MVLSHFGSRGTGVTGRDILRGTAATAVAAVPLFGSEAFASPSVDWATSLTASEAVTRIVKGDVTAEAYVSALLEQADRMRALNLFISQDRVALLEGARAVDARRKAGQALGHNSAAATRAEPGVSAP